MTTTEIQNSLIRQILSINNIDVLNKIKRALKDTQAVAYDTKGQPLTAEQYTKEISETITEMETGKDKGKTTDEILKNISDAYHLE
ncbi:MAG: hypothetical protein CSA38_04000 [Flavobacteriales bacterium]|nr:MAG: hypothetical protein CSA38_04000 [Flavobacteriales bacterium]